MIYGQIRTVQWVMVSTKWPLFMVQCAKNYKFLWPCKKVKTTGLVRIFIIPANCSNHDWRSKWNGSRRYGVHRVTPIHGIMCTKFEVFVTLQKDQETVKVKTMGLVRNFIIPANCRNHAWLKVKVKRFNELWGSQKKYFGSTHRRTVSITRSLPVYAGGQ